MPTSECPQERHAELFVRSDVPRPAEARRTAVADSLRTLAAEGALGSVTVRSWEKRVPVAGPSERLERRRFDEFAAWASDNDASLTPFFDTRECYSATTGDRETQLVLPVLCLAVYADDDLTRLAPVRTPNGAESVEDCLAALADRPPRAARTPARPAAD